MMKYIKKFIFFVFLIFVANISLAQKTFVIKGKVIDFSTNDPVPYASISVRNTSIGVNTDFEGNFVIQFPAASFDSLKVSCMGYFSRSVLLPQDSLAQTITFQLKPTEIQLHEVVVHAGENPAWAIIRKVIDNKKINNYKKLDSYEYESYNKIEVDINNISDKLREKRITKKVNQTIEKLGTLTDEEGKTLLPTFISESISHYYYRTNPRLSKEVVLKTNIQGVGVTDGSLTSQVIGSTFQQYNFYNSQIDVLNKNFSSPIANDWQLAYDYYLADSSYFGDYFCYEIEFMPKRKQDLAFSGKMWIAKNSWALTQIDATITKDANLNFVDRIKIQQELDIVSDVWFPIKNRIVVDVAEVSKKSAGMVLKFTNYNNEVIVNQPKDAKFFDKGIELSSDYKETDKKYWQTVRPEPFTVKEQLAYQMIDSIKNIPVIKRYSDIAKILSTGYVKAFKGVEFGPLVYSGAVNDVEGLRLRLGLRSSYEFSKKWILQGYVAYGTKDDAWKMGGEITHIFNRKPWTTLSVKASHDIEQVGLRKEDLGLGSIYAAYLRFFTLQRPYYENENKIQFQREVSKGVFVTAGFRTRTFDPLYSFSYKTNPSEGDTSPTKNHFQTSEFLSEVTFARDELSIINDNERLSFGTIKSPTITLRYNIGVKNILNSDFTYHNLQFKYSHTLNLGYLGKTYYKAEAGAIFGTVPYPLLKSHLGNESIFIIGNSFNLMNSYEFVSDRYLSLRYTHDFEGLMFNRLPLIKKLKWRTFTTGKFLIGELSSKNQALVSTTINNTSYRNFIGLSNTPYIELGYGINNIFKVLRIEAMHRLTYLNQPDIKKFGVKFTLELSL